MKTKTILVEVPEILINVSKSNLLYKGVHLPLQVTKEEDFDSMNYIKFEYELRDFDGNYITTLFCDDAGRTVVFESEIELLEHYLEEVVMKQSFVMVPVTTLEFAADEFEDPEEILQIASDLYPDLGIAPNHVTWFGEVSDDTAEFTILRDIDASLAIVRVRNLQNEDTPDVQSFFWEMQMNAEEIAGDDLQQLSDLHHFIMNQIEIRGWSDDTKKRVLEIYNDDKLTLVQAVGRVLEVLGGEGI